MATATAPNPAVLRDAVRALTGMTEADLADLWGDWPWHDPDALIQVAADVIPGLVWQYGDVAAGIAADTYDMWRDQVGAAGAYRATPAALAEEDQILAGIRNASGSLFQVEPDIAAVQALLAGMATRHVQRAAADTIVGSTHDDPTARGWQRVTRSDGCRFCRMLAGRGGVYLSERSSRFAAHDNCNCSVVPSWDPNAKEVPVVAYVASKRNQTPQDRARVKAFLDANFPQ